jgi:hypothetical protein
VVAGGVAAVGGATAINAYNNFTGNNFLTNNNPERTKNNWSGALDVLETGTAVLPFASKNGRTAMFGADARARTLATGKSIWNGASRAWNGAGNIASRTVGGIGNMANRTVSGAKNGLLNAEAKLNNAMDESPVLDWLFPRGGNGPQPAYAGVPNGRTTTPKVDTPETSQPMMMEGNNLDGPQPVQPTRTTGDVPETPQPTRPEVDTPEIPQPTRTEVDAPEGPVTEPDVGLSNRGYRPQPGERSTTREQWEVQSRSLRRGSTKDGYVKWVKAYGREVGRYDAMSPGSLPNSIAGTFSGGRYSTINLDKNITLYRVWSNGTSKELGGFWSLEKPRGSLQSRIESALLPEWAEVRGTPFRAKQATQWVKIEVPSGSTIHVGEVSTQGSLWSGGKSQVLIEEKAKENWIRQRGHLQ